MTWLERWKRISIDVIDKLINPESAMSKSDSSLETVTNGKKKAKFDDIIFFLIEYYSIVYDYQQTFYILSINRH